MRSFLSVLTGTLSLLGSAQHVLAAPSGVLSSLLGKRDDHPCNTNRNRACWTSSFGLHTDYEQSTPTTGVTREYTLTITQEENWTGPDGVVKELVMLINGQFPGPVLTADWGDEFSITVVNNLKENGTSMHWHGIRQLNTNLQDGVNGVTECPIPPGSSRLYRFVAHQYGTTWYHSHFSAQYGNGVVGSMIINGPASSGYDLDLGVFPVTDYYYHTADWLVDYNKNNGPPPSDNVLFNGTNVHPVTGAGAYANVTLTKGKKHRLRLINPSVENHFVLSLANHNMTVIATDLVPVQPVVVSQIFIGVGQRYDVVIEANQPVGNYWFNATFVPNGPCGASVNPAPAAIFHYAGASGGLPTDPGSVATLNTCTDMNNVQPVVSRHFDTSKVVASPSNELDVSLSFGEREGQLFTWKINSTEVIITWDHPVDEYVLTSNTSYPTSDNVVTVERRSTSHDLWVFWIIENDPIFPIPHPIHLHGHDFLVLGRSDPDNPSPFTSADIASLNGNNPVRRDVAMLPAKGWIVIAYQADNPGTWLMHCHIAWHVAGGLAVNFVERPADFRSAVNADDVTAFNDQCAAWNAYFPTDAFQQTDSGLRRRGVRGRMLGSGPLDSLGSL